MSTNQIQQIEATLKQSRKQQDLGVALDRLYKNQDFKRIVLQGFFNEEAIRLVHCKSNPNLQSPEQQKSILTQIDAIGVLDQYFNTIRQFANIASKQVEDAESLLDELRKEGEA